MFNDFRTAERLALSLLVAILAACGGGGSTDPVVDVPVFTVQPTSSVARVGNAVTFTVTVSGTSVTYQWQRSVDAGLTWADLLAATSSSYTIDAPDATMNGYQFRALARSGGNTVISAPVTLSVSSSSLAGLPYDISFDGTGKAYLASLPNVQSSTNQFAGYVQSLDLATGAVYTMAGSLIQGYANGVGSAVRFNGSQNVAGDGQGNVFVADLGNAVIRKVAADGTVSTFAGTGVVGRTDGPRNSASFVGPRGLAFDAAGNLYVADQFGFNIRKIAVNGTVSTLAGGNVAGSSDGIGTAARFTGPTHLAVGPDGAVYVADGANGVRKVTPSGVVTTVSTGVGRAEGLAIDSSGNLFVTAWTQNVIYKISPANVVSVFAGSTAGGFADGNGTAASFAAPFALAVDANGNVLVADTGNRAVRKITPAGVVSTIVR